MSFGISVEGGTGAGRRKVKQPVRWTCKCGKTHITYSALCCGDRRP